MRRLLLIGLVLILAGCAQQEVTPITPQQLDAMSEEDIFLLDVHVPEQTHIEGTDAVIDYRQVMSNLDKLPGKDEKIVVYCRSGSMSAQVTEQLANAGYKNVYDLQGGRNAWVAEGYDAKDSG